MKYTLRKDLIEAGEVPSMFCCVEGYENDTPKCISERLLAGEAFEAWTLDIDAEFNILVKIDNAFYRFPNIDFEEVDDNTNAELITAVGELEASLIDIGLADDEDCKVFDELREALKK